VRVERAVTQVELHAEILPALRARGEGLVAAPQVADWLAEHGAEYLHQSWFTGLYAAYRKRWSDPLGDRIVWREKETGYTFRVPERVQGSPGVLLVPAAGLAWNGAAREVRVAKEAEQDVVVVGFGDPDGRFPSPDARAAAALGSSIAYACSRWDWHAGSTGWHGNVVISTEDLNREHGDPVRRDVELKYRWTTPCRVLVRVLETPP
jgi:hypothetical protein